MPERDRFLFLKDISIAIGRIETYLSGFDCAGFFADQRSVDAVMRNLEVIGEAAKKLPDSMKKNHPGVEWRKLAALRDILIHHYFGIDEDIIWDVLTNKIPEVKKELDGIMVD